MSAAFTPGPWVLTGSVQLVGNPDSANGQHNLYVGEIRHQDHIGSICCIQSADHCPPAGIVRDVAEANARLIASSPDLLDALIRLCRAFPTDSDMKEAGWEGPEIEEGCNAYDAAIAAIAKALPVATKDAA